MEDIVLIRKRIEEYKKQMNEIENSILNKTIELEDTEKILHNYVVERENLQHKIDDANNRLKQCNETIEEKRRLIEQQEIEIKSLYEELRSTFVLFVGKKKNIKQKIDEKEKLLNMEEKNLEEYSLEPLNIEKDGYECKLKTVDIKIVEQKECVRILEKQIAYNKENLDCDRKNMIEAENIVNDCLKDEEQSQVYTCNVETLENDLEGDAEIIHPSQLVINDIEKTPIEEIGLSNRSYNCLKRAGIDYVQQVVTMSEYELMSIRNMGKKSVDEIVELKNKIFVKGVVIKEDKISSQEKNETMEKVRGDELSNDGEIVIQAGTLMIEVAKPEYAGREDFICTFKDKFGIIKKDFDINKLNFSVRTNNCLDRAGYKSISEIAFAKYEEITKIRNLGKKSIDEIIEYLKNNTECRILDYVETSSENEKTKEDEMSLVNNFINQVKNVLNDEESQFKFNIYADNINADIMNYLLKKEGEQYDVLEFVELLATSGEFFSRVEREVLETIDAQNYYCSKTILFASYPSVLLEKGLDENVISSLVEKRIIEQYKNVYRRIFPTLNEWIDSLKEKDKQIILLRLTPSTLNDSGRPHTLDECGQIMNVTRERIRQRQAKALERKPRLREDDFAYWFSKYAFDKELFTIVFDVDGMVFEYLKLVYPLGTMDIEEIYDDPKIDEDMYKHVHRYINRNRILIGHEYVECRRDLLCRELAKQKCSNCDILADDLYEEYKTLLKENNLLNNEKLLFNTERSFETRMQDRDYMLYKYGRKLRYYNIGERDVQALVNELHLEHFSDVEISTLKLFREYSDLMEEYDIHDEYELHNLLRKTQNIWKSDVEVDMSRMPFLVFGIVDKTKQIEDLMFKLAPISMEELSEAYEAEYGVLKSTVMANKIQLIEKYLFNGMFEINQPKLNDDEDLFLTQNMVEDFYFIDDIKKIFNDKFGLENANHLNARTIKEHGYKIYNEFIVSNKYLSSADYFEYLITKEQLFDLAKADRRLIYVQQFNVTVDQLRNNMDILEFENGKYISYGHFTNILPEYNKQTLEEYISETLEYAEGNKYFTIRFLLQDGYDHLLHHAGFEDWFYGALLKNSKRISFVRTGGTILFYEGKEKKTTVDFLRYILRDCKCMDIYELIDFIKEDYDIQLVKEKIVQLVKETELYYDGTMEKLYLKG